MQKRHFEHMATIVKAILDNAWSDDWPSWAVQDSNGNRQQGFVAPGIDSYTRAVLTAEAFIVFACEWDPRFDEQRFLQACGLVEKPSKIRRTA
jgi:hypothetical protein